MAILEFFSGGALYITSVNEYHVPMVFMSKKENRKKYYPVIGIKIKIHTHVRR